MYKSDVKKYLKKIKKNVDFTEMIWYTINAARQKSYKWSLKTKQNVNFE